ncbi:hypothetical protein Poli38472_001056 [Pythium oligandrum]|uniref:Uncharacterized protein n=1 Tax=Pythium oligandrum TaxID=41045 RepID=A0A8K1CUH3_PYTOL|nr:hypothetical protein Poli38472_001056 [Pythium oligandrum]|eukprot:TMW68900.1 hypothetical protein Poli38472_001056 [Pythium oligandrum]
MKLTGPSDDALLSERCKLTSGIVLLNAIIIAECVLLLVRATNPFFHSMDHPTPAFIVFMVLQIAYLGAAAVFSVGACAGKHRMVILNRGLFQIVAFTNVVYAIIFFVRKDIQGGLAMGFLAMVNVLGALLCRRFVLHLTWHQQLPTTSPSYNVSNTRV